MGILSKIRSPLQRRVRPGIIVPDMPSDLTLLIDARNGVLNDRLRNGLSYVAAAGNVPNGLGGVQSSTIPPVHADGFYGGPAYSNIVQTGLEDFRNWTLRGANPTLNADGSYRVTLGAGGVKDLYFANSVCTNPHMLSIEVRLVSGSSNLYLGNSSSSEVGGNFTLTSDFQTISQLTTDALTGGIIIYSYGGLDLTVDVRFPQITNGQYLFPYIPPGTSVVSTVGTTTNGLSVPLSGSSKADRLKSCFEGTTTVACLVKMGAGSAESPGVYTPFNVATINNEISYLLYYRDIGNGSYDTAISYDGSAGGALVSGTWNRNEYHLKIVETGGGKFRVGNRRYTSVMVPIDADIVWSHATLAAGAAFDGSFNPLDFLRFFYTSTVPDWLKLAWVSDQSGLGDAEILDRLSYAGH